jgi:hypothetical protein
VTGELQLEPLGKKDRNLGLTVHCDCFSLTAVLARMSRSRHPGTSPDAVGITSAENSFAVIMRSIIDDLTQSQGVSTRIIATQKGRGCALSIRSRGAKVRNRPNKKPLPTPLGNSS